MKRFYILAVYLLSHSLVYGQAQQHLPYPIIFIHGLNSDNNTAWDNLNAFLKSPKYNLTYGGNMDFCLNYDGKNDTSDTSANAVVKDYMDFSAPIQLGDFYTVNFDVDNTGKAYAKNNNLSNQAAIVKQGMAISDAIKHVLDLRKLSGDNGGKVILVGHSMGGLAAREYLQNGNLWYEPNVNHHVAKLCTVGTPHGGSNIGELTGPALSIIGSYLSGIDQQSEAVRDLRGNYTYLGSLFKGIFLFGGNELKLKVLIATIAGLSNGLTIPFYNYDVNCSGNTAETVVGLNSKILPDIPYSSVFGKNFPVLGGDGIVSEQSGNLNNYFANLNADTFQVQNIFHTALTSQFFSIIKGIDEPSELRFAYNVALNKIYNGLITFPPANSPTSSDIDDYAVNLNTAGKLNLNVTIPSVINVFTASVYDANYTLIYHKNNNGASNINVNVPIPNAGKYYVVFAGLPTGDSWQYPYLFQLGFTSSNSYTGNCFSFLSASSGNFSSLNYGNNTDCSWLVSPPGSSSITLHFNNFNTESNGDIVNIYDGNDKTYPLLGSYSGSTIPPYITSSGGTMFVEFVTNGSVTASGWSANYTSSSTSVVERAPANLNAYRYWYDGDITNGAIVYLTTSSDASIGDLIQPKNSLNRGFHTLSYMVQQSDKAWSVPVDNNFYYSTSGGNALYEYWFDSTYSQKQTVQIGDTNNLVLANQMLNMASMANGFHQFNIRYKPNGGSWSLVQSSNVFKRGNDINAIIDVKQIRYWFDTSFSKKKEIITTGQSGIINNLIDCSNLSIGKHNVNYQTMDNGNIWSSILIDSFTVACTPPANPTVSSKNAITFCQGLSDTLVSSSNGGNQWYLNGISIDGAINTNFVATASGNYSVVVTSNGCISDTSNKITISVNSIPTMPTITSNNATTFCQGLNDTLVSSATIGNQWLLNGVAINGATNTTYIASRAGNYSVQTTNGNACTSVPSASTTITVNPLPVTPSISAGSSTTFCTGGSVVLTSSTSSGNQWFWNGTAINGATNVTFTATGAGNYTVQMTNTNSCTSAASVAITVAINALPTTPVITNSRPLSFCNGDSTILTSSVTSGIQWQQNNVNITGATASNLLVKQSGIYNVIATNSYACTATSTSIPVINNPYPAKPPIIWNGSQFSTASGMAAYQWLLNNFQIIGATNNTYTPVTTGNYRIRVATAAGCADTSVAYQLVVTAIVPVSLNGNPVKLYPNPAHSEAWLEFGQIPIYNVRIRILNVIGQVIQNFTTRQKTVHLQFQKLSQGLYFIEVNNGKEKGTLQLFKQ